MIYHCKKCGGVVTGKYCSSCGTRATTDLEDFRREIKRRGKEFVGARTKLGDDYFSRVHIADAAWRVSERSVYDDISHLMNVDAFHGVSAVAWGRIPEIAEKAGRFYDGAMLLAAAIFKEAK